MTWNQYNNLKDTETARHQKIVAELDFRMKQEQLSCSHPVTVRIGIFTAEIQVQCQHCGHTFTIKKNEPLHPMQKESPNNNQLDA